MTPCRTPLWGPISNVCSRLAHHSGNCRDLPGPSAASSSTFHLSLAHWLVHVPTLLEASVASETDSVLCMKCTRFWLRAAHTVSHTFEVHPPAGRHRPGISSVSGCKTASGLETALGGSGPKGRPCPTRPGSLKNEFQQLLLAGIGRRFSSRTIQQQSLPESRQT